MPYYFFRLREDGHLLPDDGEGQEFESPADVLREAIEAARELLSQAVLSGKAASLNQQIEVFDDAGKRALTMPVGRAIDTESQS